MSEVALNYRCADCRDRGWVVTRPDASSDGNGRARPCHCQQRKRGNRLLDEAQIPQRYAACTVENYLPTGDGAGRDEQVRAKAICERYIEEFLKPDGTFCESGLLFVGRAGVGKTHLAVACLSEVMRRYGRAGRFVDFTTLVHQIQVSFDPSSEESRQRLLDPLGRAEVLVLDELGAQKPTPFVRDLLYLVINTRYARRLPTLFTTNFALQRPGAPAPRSLDRGPDYQEDSVMDSEITLQSRIGKPLLSRLFEMARPVELTGVLDYRREFRMHHLQA